MDTETGKLTVFFEDPFWVGVFERTSGGRLSVCKVTFGAEPKDCQIWEFVLRHYDQLRFSPAVDVQARPAVGSPKRRQRAAQKQQKSLGVGTKSQQALQMQREAVKTQKKQIDKERREAEEARQFDLKQQKRKAKHRGH